MDTYYCTKVSKSTFIFVVVCLITRCLERKQSVTLLPVIPTYTLFTSLGFLHQVGKKVTTLL